jgi:penicillin-binding protein 1C
VVTLSSILLALLTAANLAPPTSLRPVGTAQPRILARDGTGLSISYLDPWNVHDTVAYHEVPELLREAFLAAEDQRFFSHRGVDWLARGHAFVQALRAGRVVRGASTITEQVVRILNPRPRNLWSRWLEGFEAGMVERRFSKAEIFECYLNQVPYASNRRGVAQAAHTYFDRDLDTLSPHETLALAVLVRSPSRLDLGRGTAEIEVPLERLARRMHDRGFLDDAELAAIVAYPLVVVRPHLEVEAAHFVRFVRNREEPPETGVSTRAQRKSSITTTLDSSLQIRVRRILDRQVEDLSERGVTDGTALVVDHTTDEILAWVSAFGFSDRPGGQIDKVLTPRQPGSTLKPFLYALALEEGWTGATIIDDTPLEDSVGHGLHSYRNYSRHFYGPVRLREALGNSLNVPAVRTARFVGRDRFLMRLRDLGLESLSRHADFYGDGLALGNGEVTLLELTRAYAVIARGGVRRPLRGRLDLQTEDVSPRRIFDPEVSSLIAHILSDPSARSREFGHDSVLNLPVQTAVKTGTSNDYRDAWAVGFSSRYTVGVWMGNIDGTPTYEVSGSQGPALVLRAVFAELHRHSQPLPLFLSRRLVRRPVCAISGRPAGPTCPSAIEWFREPHVPAGHCRLHIEDAAPNDPDRNPHRMLAAVAGRPQLVSPAPGLHLAKDPRIPDELELFPLRLADGSGVRRTEWLVDGRLAAETGGGEDSWPWPVERGRHTAQARIWTEGSPEPVLTASVEFLVK